MSSTNLRENPRKAPGKSPESTVIDFRDVSFSYDQTPLLNEASFRIYRGECIGVIGPNGGGKTTALKLMMAFLQPNRGEVLLFNAPPKASRNRIGYVPQSHGYDRRFPISVLDVVLLGAASSMTWFGGFGKGEKNRAKMLLDLLGIRGLEKRLFGSLSGGQAQKVLIARACMADPDLLLLDEPTAHIDAQSTTSIFKFLHAYQGEKTIVIVMHDYDAIVKYTQRILCFQKRVSLLQPEELCEHFSIGMYHTTRGRAL